MLLVLVLLCHSSVKIILLRYLWTFYGICIQILCKLDISIERSSNHAKGLGRMLSILKRWSGMMLEPPTCEFIDPLPSLIHSSENYFVLILGTI